METGSDGTANLRRCSSRYETPQITLHRGSSEAGGSGDGRSAIRVIPGEVEDQERESEEEEEEGDAEVREVLSKSIKQVQALLDQNRALIRQVNENQRSKVPENLERNVVLIREINGNISKTVSLYSNLSVDFCNLIHLRRRRRRESDMAIGVGRGIGQEDVHE